VLQGILFERIGANYHGADEVELWRIRIRPDGKLHPDPIGPVLQTIKDAGQFLMKHALAERNGIDVGEAVYPLSFGEIDALLLGWGYHDGPLFDK
jgi:hypothetical protein